MVTKPKKAVQNKTTPKPRKEIEKMSEEIQIVPRLAWGPQAVDYQERINFDRLRKERLERTRAGMRKRGIAAVILTTINLRYATATRSPEWRYRGSDLGVVFAEHDPIVYLSHEAVVHNRIFTPWIKFLRSAAGWKRRGSRWNRSMT
jgi:hypothetical protein